MDLKDGSFLSDLSESGIKLKTYFNMFSQEYFYKQTCELRIKRLFSETKRLKYINTLLKYVHAKFLIFYNIVVTIEKTKFKIEFWSVFQVYYQITLNSFKKMLTINNISRFVILRFTNESIKYISICMHFNRK